LPKYADLAKGFARSLTADVMGGFGDTAVNLENLARAGYGYAGSKLGMLSPSQLPELREPKDVPLTSDWLVKNTPLEDTGSSEYTTGRLASWALPFLSGFASRAKIPPPTSADQLGAIVFPGWHGTPNGEFSVFRPNIRKNEQLGFGIHAADNRSFAERYALSPRKSVKNAKPTLYQVEAEMENPLKADEIVMESDPRFALAQKLAGQRFFSSKDEKGIPATFLQNAIDATSPQRAERLIRDAGYDGIRYMARYGNVNPGGTSANIAEKSPASLVFTPEQIKIIERLNLSSGFGKPP